jgi:hypothetical protein
MSDQQHGFTLDRLNGPNDARDAERRAVVLGYPWHVVGGTGRTVAAFRTRADAERYRALHPAYRTVERG